MDTEMRVLLERMNGNIELIKSGQTRQADDIRRMEERFDQNIKRIDDRLQSHSSRLQLAEAQQRFDDGERTGVDRTIARTAKAAYIMIGGSVSAIVTAVCAIILRSFHV